MSDDSISSRAIKAVEDAFDETVKGRVEAMFNNLAGGMAPLDAASKMRRGLIEMKAGRDAALKIIAETFP